MVQGKEKKCIFVEGGYRLSGEIKISGAKNAALPALAAAILGEGKFEFYNIPWVLDVYIMLELLSSLGATFHKDPHRLLLDTTPIYKAEASWELVSQMRASILVLGPLVARFGQAKVFSPGGCKIGERPINFHLKGLEALGATYTLDKGYINMKAPQGLRGAEIIFDCPSVTGTENIMMAATLAKGKTILRNVAKEPEVVFLGEMLNKMGAKIQGLGTETLIIEGVKRLNPVKIEIIPDRIETGTYLMAVGVAGGELLLKNTNPSYLETVIAKLKEIGFYIEWGEKEILVKEPSCIQPVEVRTAPYPGFPTDLQAQIMAVLTKARGTSVIVENIFEKRFNHVSELRRMGANIVVEGRVAVVKGVERLQGAPVIAEDLRASASLVLAALGAEGITQISAIHHLKRGYEKLTEKLSQVGSHIWEETCKG